MTWLLAVLMLQETASQADQIRAAMAASLEKQNASVRVQAQAVGAGAAIGGSIDMATPPVSSCSSLSGADLDKLIEEVSQSEHLDAAVIRGLARQEPRLRPCPASPKAAEGLVPPKTVEGSTQLTTPAQPPIRDASDAK